MPPWRIGPLLYMRGVRDDRILLTALIIRPVSEAAPELVAEETEIAGRTVLERCGHRVVEYAFSLPARSGVSYRVGRDRYAVDAAFDGDLRIAYVSCNGQEQGDCEREGEERNALWRRLARQHGERPFQLLLHGGDQIYADELAETHPLAHGWPKADPPELNETDAAKVAEALRAELFRRYLQLYAQPEMAWLMARVPSLAMWDDHDICDGWGSLPARKLDSTLGRIIFDVAREHFLLFQLGTAPGRLADSALDGSGTSLGWHMPLPRLHIVAPDLRSERRPDRVMGPHGWNGFRAALDEAQGARVLVLSSVPALGPRLSWVEAVMRLTPMMETYEDDLRDQWQSRVHRAEWRAFLKHLIAAHGRAGTCVTVISGEIHLATRATLATSHEPLHQLVASGIAHPPPSMAYARALGALARLGESPLPGHPIRLHPLPGQSGIYTPQRNYLVLERQGDEWRAWWELESDGATPAMIL